jgi:hypothetical protein
MYRTEPSMCPEPSCISQRLRQPVITATHAMQSRHWAGDQGSNVGTATTGQFE